MYFYFSSGYEGELKVEYMQTRNVVRHICPPDLDL